MLNNLNWLESGAQFPPECERERLERYAQNKRIFENRHMEVYNDQWRRIEKVVGSSAEVISYPIVLNFQKKISLKTADFLFMEKPIISASNKKKSKEKAKDGKKDSLRQQEVIDAIVEQSDLFSIGYQGAIDCSRYGTTVFKIDVEGGKGKISISSPEFLFTVVSKEDRKKVENYVLAWMSDTVDEVGKEQVILTTFIHSKGSYTKKVFKMKDRHTIGALLIEERDRKTHLKDFAIVPVHNVLTSDSVYGIDDYMDVDSIVSELEIRTAQISKILDTHANPTVSGSQNALSYDKVTGQYYFDAGNFYSRTTNEEPPLEYITWDANLTSNFNQVEKLLNYLSTISEMGAAIFDGDLKTGNLPSGSALKRLYINVLAKVARVRNAFDKGFKRAIATASEAGHKCALGAGDVNITWQDGLPNDTKEQAEIINIRTAGAQTMSAKRAMMVLDKLNNDAADDEMKDIEMEQMMGSGMTIPINLEKSE